MRKIELGDETNLSDHAAQLRCDVQLEYYKFILGELHTLNENVHKYLTLFQTLATTLITAGIAVFAGWQQLHLTVEAARTAIRGLLWLLVLLAIFVVLAILAGIFSWFDYRHEEVRILDHVVHKEYRREPNKRNFLRWQETYILLFVLLFTGLIFFYVHLQILPLIKIK